MSNNNPQNTFVTLAAVLLVLVTLYFTTNALKRTYESNRVKIEEENRQRELQREHTRLVRQQLAAKELQRQADISAKLKEHQHICYDLQIFTIEIKNKEQLKQPTSDSESFPMKLMQSKKTLRKKDLNKTQQPKKGASTEPIIYLFVLVLLYLLLRAASDITQHFKEQSKGDKRNNRRCSLQVYAAMKNDRRSSKDRRIQKLSQIEETRLLTMNSRSKSVDRPILQRSKRIYPNLRSYTSVDERASCSSSSLKLAEDPTENDVIPKNLALPNLRPKSVLVSEVSSSRRCSVPSLSLQQVGALNLRTASIEIFAEEDLLGVETKKRHRMIHRH